MSDDIKVLGISGSLRSGSYNSAALQEAIGLVPPGMSIELADISGIRCTTRTSTPSASRPRWNASASRSARRTRCCSPPRNTTIRWPGC